MGDILRSDSTVNTVTDQNPLDNSFESSDIQIVNLINRLKDEAKQRRTKYASTPRLNNYMKVYNGEHYPEISYSPYTKWKSRQVVNYTGDVIDFITSFLLEQSPHPFAVPPNDDQQKVTELLQAVIDDVWEENEMDGTQLENYTKTALIMGNSYAKVYFDSTLNEGMGAIVIDLVDPRDLYVDPNCKGNLRKARYIIWEKSIPYDEAVRRFPKYRKYIENNMTKDWNQDAKDEIGPQVTYFNSTGTQTWDFSIFSPLKDSTTKSGDAFTPIQGSTDKVMVTEAWLRDYTQIKKKVTTKDSLGKETTEEKIVYKYKKCIRLVTIVGNKVVQDGSTPYVGFNGFPYAGFIDKPIPFESQGLGTVSQIWPMQMDINKKKSYISDYQKFAGNPIWIVDKESGVKRSELSNIPGLVVQKQQGTTVQRESPPELPQYFFTGIKESVDELREVSGATDVVMGKKQKGTRSGEQQSDLRDSAQGKLRLKLLALKKSVATMGEIILALVEQYYTDVRILRIAGDYHEPQYLKFSGTMVNGPWRVRVESMPSTPSTRQARFDQAMRLFSMNVIDKKALMDIIDFPNKEKIMKRMQEMDAAYFKSISEGKERPKTGKQKPKF